ncbi:MAG: tripartite tricarboxylate transporter substrate binding protein [Deltaproteobacteria bacterium]
MERHFRFSGLIWLIALVAIVLMNAQVVRAEEFPAKPINLLLPYGAGASTDITARAFAGAATEAIGQPLVIQAKPGAGGAIASDLVVQAAPDGYTLLMGSTGPNTTLPAIEGRSKGPNDLMAVCRIQYNAHLVLVPANAPYKTMKELIQYAKANPGKIRFGSVGLWGASDLVWKQVQLKTGISTKIMPYDDGNQSMVALLGGHVDVMSSYPTNTASQIKAGKMIPLAISDSKRDPDFPNVPTLKETGIDVDVVVWKGIMAPPKTPRPIIDKLALGFKKMLENKNSLDTIHKLGDNFHYLGPDEMTKVWREEYDLQKELGKSFKTPAKN